ncbi:Tir chaperone protein (CesT) family, putative [Leishmania lindenbergi]|uniref:Tir chaperone protein (CesT) family n=1 Tax=Leishmania lindenbergi TaxID=651832 RepID=A0AAW3A461_9TRYP
MEERQAFFVESTDGRKFKMVIRGDLGKLSVAKIRRYLRSYGVPENQQLLFGDRVLEDDMLGEDFGLEDEGVLHLSEPSVSRRPETAAIPSAPPPQQQQQRPYAPQETWRDEPAARSTQEMKREIERLQRQVDAAVARNADLENQLAQAAKSSADYSAHRGASGARGMSKSIDVDGLQVAKESLNMLSQKLQVSLYFDKNLTCVVGTDEDFSILLTYDPATERLYIYSSLLTELPENLPLRMKLYELLLEGSLLGREVCGGGIGLSTQNNVVVLTTSLPMRHCSAAALCETLPLFVETLLRWRSLVDELLR